MSEEIQRRSPYMPRPGGGEGQYCVWCGGHLERSRKDRQFCSDNHRMAFRRWRERLYDITRRAMADIKEISEFAPWVMYVDPRAQISAISAHLERYREVTQNRVKKAEERYQSDH